MCNMQHTKTREDRKITTFTEKTSGQQRAKWTHCHACWPYDWPSGWLMFCCYQRCVVETIKRIADVQQQWLRRTATSTQRSLSSIVSCAGWRFALRSLLAASTLAGPRQATSQTDRSKSQPRKRRWRVVLAARGFWCASRRPLVWHMQAIVVVMLHASATLCNKALQ